MKQGKTIETLVQELERQAKTKQDFVLNTRSAVLQNDEFIKLGVTLEGQYKALPMTKHAHQQVATRIGIPWKYYERMGKESKDLLTQNVNHWFHTEPENRMFRTLDGKVRAVVSDKYKRIDNYEVLSTLLPILRQNPNIQIKSQDVTPTHMYLKAVYTDTRYEVQSKRVGDFVEAGFMLTNSEIGLGAVTFTPFFHFLVCTNGMVSNRAGETFRATHMGKRFDIEDKTGATLSQETIALETQTTLSRLGDAMRHCTNPETVRRNITRLQESVQRPIQQRPTEAVEQAAKLLSLTEAEQDGVLTHLIQSDDFSQYGLINAITRTAQDVPSYDRATELEAMGTKVLDMGRREWGAIATPA